MRALSAGAFATCAVPRSPSSSPILSTSLAVSNIACRRTATRGRFRRFADNLSDSHLGQGSALDR
jgi:hypothetical protein